VPFFSIFERIIQENKDRTFLNPSGIPIMIYPKKGK
jgi:hypothetical protein